ncbi:MAG: dihydrodipicolinate synthase [Rhodospirillales bacterium]|nr:dihydrodipicolinate synthase [Rhodospirillales bacterium]
MPNLRIEGVVVATVLPFDVEGAIDWSGYARVLDHCACLDGITAVFVNGHAGEGASLTPAERAQVIERTRKHVGTGKPILSGIIAFSTAAAVEQAREAEAAGADCAVLFPPPLLGNGASATARAPVAYVKAVSEAIDIPVSLFQYPLTSGLGWTTDTLVEMARIPGVVAIKEGSDCMRAYEENWHRIKEANPDVAILPSNYNWFLAQLAVGGDGLLSGLASLVPDMLIDLWTAAQAKDLDAMRAANDRLRPVVRCIYGTPPLIDMHTRIKAGLQSLGVIANAAPRAPLMPVSDAVRAEIERTMKGVGLRSGSRTTA